MSDTLVECSLCGRNGGPFAECARGCGGRAEFVQKRQYTLSEERSGRAPVTKRYGDGGEVGPAKSDPLWAGTE